MNKLFSATLASAILITISGAQAAEEITDTQMDAITAGASAFATQYFSYHSPSVNIGGSVPGETNTSSTSARASGSVDLSATESGGGSITSTTGVRAAAVAP
jgi:hypothetical protein